MMMMDVAISLFVHPSFSPIRDATIMMLLSPNKTFNPKPCYMFDFPD
jgi:hypothetical protein